MNLFIFRMFQLSPLVVFKRSQQPKAELHGREMADEFCLKMPDFHVTFRYLLHAVKLRHGTDGFTSLPRGRRAEDFFALKNPTASAGFEPADLSTRGQHATCRPPKPLRLALANPPIFTATTYHDHHQYNLQSSRRKETKKKIFSVTSPPTALALAISTPTTPPRRHFDAGLSPQAPTFDPRPVHVIFIVDNLIRGQVSLRILQVFGFTLSVSFHRSSMSVRSYITDALPSQKVTVSLNNTFYQCGYRNGKLAWLTSYSTQQEIPCHYQCKLDTQVVSSRWRSPSDDLDTKTLNYTNSSGIFKGTFPTSKINTPKILLI